MQLNVVHTVVAVCGLGSCRVIEALVYAALKVRDNLVLVKGEYSICADTIKQTTKIPSNWDHVQRSEEILEDRGPRKKCA